MVKSKQDILGILPELELTDGGDFVVRGECVRDYEIIDFHTHSFQAVAGFLPSPFRRELDDERACFFDLSCYPGSVGFFDFDRVGYRLWPERLWSLSGFKTALDLFGFNGVISMLRRAGLGRLLRDMRSSGVSRAVVLPINSIKADNTTALLKGVSEYERLIPFASIHPLEGDIEARIDTYVSGGARGFKINPHVQKVGIDDGRMIELVKRLTRTRLPILSCSGLAIPARYLGQFPGSFRRSVEMQNLNRYETLLRVIPDHPFIFAHGGLEQNRELVALMRKFPNTYADISTQTVENIRRMIDEIGSRRLLFGSDYPFFNQAFPIVSLLRATGDHGDRRAIFSGNARRLLGLPVK